MGGGVHTGSMLRCGLCGQRITASHLRTVLGETFCASHRDLDLCGLCGAPFILDARQNLPSAYCGRCSVDAVRDQATVKRVLPPIRRQLRSMGIQLTVQVQVRLVSAAEMSALDGRKPGSVNGLTISCGQTVLELAVVAGLPLTVFGTTVAHETTHAWMAQEGFVTSSAQISEGLCQLAAHGWLSLSTGRGAKALQKSIEDSPDIVYGVGYRMVRAAVRKHGLRTVLTRVRRTGDLP